MTIGEKIKELRNVNRISQEKIAELLDVSRQAVSKWETGQSLPTTENLLSLAKIFNVSVEQLAHPNTRVELVMEVKIVTILRFVYNDCKKRKIKPTFWVIISTTMIGLIYYFLKRDYLSSDGLE